MAAKKKTSKKAEVKTKAVVTPAAEPEKTVAKEIVKPPVNPEIPAVVPVNADPVVAKAIKQSGVNVSEIESNYVFTDKVVFVMKNGKKVVAIRK
jgi:hypothetical protein